MEQKEIDDLLKGIDLGEEGGAEAAKPEEDLTWDDVQEEMALSQTKKPPTDVSEVNFREIPPSAPPSADARKSLDLDFILDIPLTLNVELGRNRMLISDLLQLGQGSVVELAKLAGEPMDVYVNQRLIARGEVVVVNEKFGIRLTDIVSPVDRINNLR
ncbi:MAG: flagellar motor switch protein FliN [Deltaproteobacteria bacterium HGW-Deltaproteobacteria-19]|jgi:flagellar motor switch protein FliN/FliY|nr:MAG: flagellar motor switch protein FliN [Deltaproteobacteria bacterium HGW-Deltaproteobacteria-19]